MPGTSDDGFRVYEVVHFSGFLFISLGQYGRLRVGEPQAVEASFIAVLVLVTCGLLRFAPDCSYTSRRTT